MLLLVRKWTLPCRAYAYIKCTFGVPIGR